MYTPNIDRAKNFDSLIGAVLQYGESWEEAAHRVCKFKKFKPSAKEIERTKANFPGNDSLIEEIAKAAN